MDADFILDKLSETESLYLKPGSEQVEQVSMLDISDAFSLYRVDEVTFEDKAPRKEALENVISSMRIDGVNFVYIILGDASGVRFYYGVVRNHYKKKNGEAIEAADVGSDILKPSLQGNFRGSVITEMSPDEKKIILGKIDTKFKYIELLEGVPGINEDDEAFQSVDRLIDVMLGDEFAIMLIAQPLTEESIYEIQNRVYHLYNTIAPLGKTTVQRSEGQNTGTSESKTDGKSESKGSTTSESKQEGISNSTSHTKGESSGTNKGTSINKDSVKTSKGGTEGSHKDVNSSDTKSDSKSQSTSTTTGDSKSSTKTTSNTESTQQGSNTGSAATVEIIDKRVQDWIKYMDEVVLPRVDYGLGKGLFVTSTVLMGDLPASLKKLENTWKSIYGGETGNRLPLRAFEIDEEEKKLFRHMQIPQLVVEKTDNSDEIDVKTACSQFFDSAGKVLLGSWMSSQELSLMTSLPQKEVVGMALREEVEFGLNIDDKRVNPDPFTLGYLVQSGVALNGENGLPDIPVKYDRSYFDKHIFVTGVTGSGKTTTCQRLLLESGYNFLVIEPAKTEYRAMAETIDDMIVFTLGKETAAPFRLNPFELFEGENITSRVDMITASLEAAFDMEAAIPQLFETAIYECYKDKGWNISTNKNYMYEDPFADGVFSFPTLGDLEKKIEKVVENQGFDDKLRDEYIGSMRARLSGLTVGAKGLMLNTPRSIDFVDLLDKKVVMELEYIKSASEKSLIMGFILSNLSEAIKVKYRNDKGPIKHLTLVEEAHRLLSRYMPGDNMNKKQAVEMFTDMLAEVRKYGESMIIADQIPDKLTPEVLKNTNTKIVHKLFAQDDKDAIGNTMALKDEQKEYLSYLNTGRAVIMMPGLSRAVQVQIMRDESNNTERVPSSDEQLRKRITRFYAEEYRRGILPGLEKLSDKPSAKLVKIYLEHLQPNSLLVREYRNCIHHREISESLVREIRELKKNYCYCFTRIVEVFCCQCHIQEKLNENKNIYGYVEELLNLIAEKGGNLKIKDYEHLWDLDGSLVL